MVLREERRWTEAAGTCVRSGLSRALSGRGVSGAGFIRERGVVRPSYLLCPQNMRRRFYCRVVRLVRSDRASPRFTSRLLTALRVYAWLRRTGRIMPRMPVLCLFPRRRVTLLLLMPGLRMAHLEPPRHRPVSTVVSWGPFSRAAKAGRGGRKRVA